jgi:YbbR domain-containing protein
VSLLRRLLFDDWPVKLAAVGLSVVLYAGVALSEDTRSWDGDVPIDVLRAPAGGALLEQPGSVTRVSYRAPIEAIGQVTAGSFRASIDLSRVEPRADAEPVSVPVELMSVDPRIRIVDYTPRSVNVRVDDVVTRGIPVTIETGPIPEGIEVGPIAAEPARVFLRGASSRIANVRAAIGRVGVDASGLNIDQDVLVDAYDDADAVVPGIEIDPTSVRVRADVARSLGYVTIPVAPELVGEPARGLRIASVRVTPSTVTVGGEDAAVRTLTLVRTEPIDVAGLAGPREVEVGLRLPTEVTVEGEPHVTLTIEVAPDVGTRTIALGASMTGARPGLAYRLEDAAVSVVLGGTIDALDSLDASALVADVPVGDLDVGTHEVAPVLELPSGVDERRIVPERVRVTVEPAGASTDASTEEGS